VCISCLAQGWEALKEQVAPASWPAVAWTSRSTPHTTQIGKMLSTASEQALEPQPQPKLNLPLTVEVGCVDVQRLAECRGIGVGDEAGCGVGYGAVEEV